MVQNSKKQALRRKIRFGRTLHLLEMAVGLIRKEKTKNSPLKQVTGILAMERNAGKRTCGH
jgi:hypothetical protein